MNIRLSTVVLVLTLGWSLPYGTAREWTDSTGKFTVEAELVSVEKAKVKLKRKDGQIIEISIQRLSQADQEFIESAALNDDGAKEDRNADDPKGDAVQVNDELEQTLKNVRKVEQPDLGVTFAVPRTWRLIKNKVEDSHLNCVLTSFHRKGRTSTTPVIAIWADARNTSPSLGKAKWVLNRMVSWAYKSDPEGKTDEELAARNPPGTFVTGTAASVGDTTYWIVKQENGQYYRVAFCTDEDHEAPMIGCVITLPTAREKLALVQVVLSILKEVESNRKKAN